MYLYWKFRTNHAFDISPKKEWMSNIDSINYIKNN